MHFRFDDDQLAMRDAVRSFCDDRFDLTRLAEREGLGADPATWASLAELGVLGMLAGEVEGFGPVETSVVFEELGAHLAAGPVLWSALAAPLVDGVATGDVRATGVEAPAGDGPVVVDHGAESDVVLVLRADRLERLDLAVVPDVGPASPMDPLTPMVVLPALPAGEVVAEGGAVTELRRNGAVLAAAELVGGAQAVLDAAREYALEREQFGVPIGSFQAVKHLLADCYVRVEMARAATYAAAALAAGRGEGDADHAASTAKHLAGQAGVQNSRTAIQVLGGMGFTWEMLPHYVLKRSWVLERRFGTTSAHAARLAALVGAEVGSS